MSISNPGTAFRKVAPFLSLLALACSAESGSGQLPFDSPPSNDVGLEQPVDVNTAPQDVASPAVGSGSIKSYLEETELEPSFLTGSIFANGFTLNGSQGLGGAGGGTILDNPVQQLGLGWGDLSVLVLFDRSISMSDLWEGQPKWKVAGRAFMNGMQGYEEQVTIATLFFPQSAECDVAPLSDPRQIQFQSGTRFKQHWEAYPQNRFPSGGTPLGPAFERANEVIMEAEEYGLLSAQRRFRVAIITDGKPNCGTDPERVLYLAREWALRGVEINVIGLPGSDEATSFLNELAAVGGGSNALASPTDSVEAEDSFAVIVK